MRYIILFIEIKLLSHKTIYFATALTNRKILFQLIGMVASGGIKEKGMRKGG